MTVDDHWRELRKRRVGCLVEQNEEPRLQNLAGSVVTVKGLGDEVVEENSEHDADAGLVAERR